MAGFFISRCHPSWSGTTIAEGIRGKSSAISIRKWISMIDDQVARDSDPSLTGSEGSDQLVGSRETAKRSNIGDNEAAHTNIEDSNAAKSTGTSERGNEQERDPQNRS